MADDRDLGSYYVAKGLLYPKSTVRYQTDYGVDKHGNPLDASKSLGSWFATDFVMIAFNWSNNFPAAGTLLTEGTWSYFFNDSEEKDNLYSVGRQKANEPGASNGYPAQYGRFDVNGGSGKYAEHGIRPNVVKTIWYLSTAGNVLIKVEFDKEVEVHY